jgi:nitronate monooxygenase
MKENLLDISYPIIQAPMAGNIITPELVAAVSNAGMLGSIASGYLTLDGLEKFILAVKALTEKPFAVNIFIEEERETQQILAKPQLIIDLEVKTGVPVENHFTVPATISQDEYVSLLLKHKVTIVSCTFGLFNADNMLRLKQQNVIVIANATSLVEVKAAYQHGVDAIIIQGSEAGGHQASFLSNECNTLSSLELLHQAISLNLTIPLIVTGGINLNNFTKFLAAGASYVQLGTSFMLSNLSKLTLAQQQYITAQDFNSTKLSPMPTGKWVRGINNQLMQSLTHCDYPFPLQHYATTKLRSFAREHEFFEFAGFWLGQHTNYAQQSTESLLQQLIKQYSLYLK